MKRLKNISYQAENLNLLCIDLGLSLWSPLQCNYHLSLFYWTIICTLASILHSLFNLLYGDNLVFCHGLADLGKTCDVGDAVLLLQMAMLQLVYVLPGVHPQVDILTVGRGEVHLWFAFVFALGQKIVLLQKWCTISCYSKWGLRCSKYK